MLYLSDASDVAVGPVQLTSWGLMRYLGTMALEPRLSKLPEGLSTVILTIFKHKKRV